MKALAAGAMLTIAFGLHATSVCAQSNDQNGRRPPSGNRTPIVAPEYIPGGAHGHYRQQLPYGNGYRYGHGVNGPMGDIIIWSADPTRGYESTHAVGPKPRQPIRPPRHHLGNTSKRDD